MSARLIQIIDEYIVRNGTEGFATLGKLVDRDAKSIRRWRSEGIPSPHMAYKLALACGCSDEEALKLAKPAPQKTQRTG